MRNVWGSAAETDAPMDMAIVPGTEERWGPLGTPPSSAKMASQKKSITPKASRKEEGKNLLNENTFFSLEGRL